MVTIVHTPVSYVGGVFSPTADLSGKIHTMTYRILTAHNTSGNAEHLKIRFDAMASHDITYVGIIQTARASGLTEFPLPYVLTNCHNSLCAVGGTINEDDHAFGLSAAKKYGGEFVPAHQSVIHSYMREMYAGCGKMILGSDSHTRYGAYGTMAIGEGGPELAKQLLRKTYDIDYPRVIAVWLEGRPIAGVGPQDVALALIGKTFPNGFAKNAVLEFFGPGVANLAMDYRAGIDVMTTETGCLSSVWTTDETVRDTLTALGRPQDYAAMAPEDGACYDALVTIDLSKVVPMIAVPFHPSNVYTIREFNENPEDIAHEIDVRTAETMELKEPAVSLRRKIRNGRFYADQGVIAGCSGGTYQNMMLTAAILNGTSVGDFPLSVYPTSQPVALALTRNGAMEKMMLSGASVRSCFCGPCFGAGDVPVNGGFSIRHSTRNFPNREGSRPTDGQLAYVALMDARSIAATALNGGAITPATDLPEVPLDPSVLEFPFDRTPYDARVYFGVGKANPDLDLVYGPNITDWPAQIAMPEHYLLEAASAIYDEVTTTDELIPSGETSSYRSNPQKLAEFTLSRKDPQYVVRAKAIRETELLRRADPANPAVAAAMAGFDPTVTGFGSFVMARKPGDGSAREQAASCQRVLGGCANLCEEYATKRYRSNLINWGMLPFTVHGAADLGIQPGDRLYIPNVRAQIAAGAETLCGILLQGDAQTEITLSVGTLTADERDILLAGCLMNYYAQ